MRVLKKIEILKRNQIEFLMLKSTKLKWKIDYSDSMADFDKLKNEKGIRLESAQ